MARDFTPKPAIRSNIPLLTGLSGPPGSGKTLSALLLASGMQADRGGEIVVLDTDGDRALMYAPKNGEKADGINTFDFKHVSFPEPYPPADFLAAIRQQLPSKPACIIVDSMSAEHEGEGGVLSWHDAELDRMAGNDWAKRDRMSAAAWIRPKKGRRDMLNGLMQIKNVPLIFCFQAREKTKPIKDANGKLVPTNIGWTPIAPPEIVHSMTIFCLLPIRSDGVPMWKGTTAYEDFSIKWPAQFRDIFHEGEQINASMGKRLSEWARGADVTGAAQTGAKAAPNGRAPAAATMSLTDRAEAFLKRVAAAGTREKINAIWAASEGLRAELDAREPELLIEVTNAWELRRDEIDAMQEEPA